MASTSSSSPSWSSSRTAKSLLVSAAATAAALLGGAALVDHFFFAGAMRRRLFRAADIGVGGDAAAATPRYLFKLASHCSIEQRCEGKQLAADSLGGEGVLRAIEDSPCLVTILVLLLPPPSLQQQQQQAVDESRLKVVGTGILKPGVQDIELESLVGELERFIARRRDSGEARGDERIEMEAISAEARRLARSSSSLGGEAFAPVLVGEAMRPFKKETTNESLDSGAAAAQAAVPPLPQKKNQRRHYQRRLIAAEINFLAVDPAHRGCGLGVALTNVLGAIAVHRLSVIEVQGTAASEGLAAGFYTKRCAPPVLDRFMKQSQQFFCIDCTHKEVHEEVLSRCSPNRFSPLFVLHAALQQLIHEKGLLCRPEFGPIA